MNNPIFLTNQELLKGIMVTRRNARILERSIRLSAAEAGLSLSQQSQELLETLYFSPYHRAQEIAQLLGISKQSLSRHLKHLISIGFVIEHPDPSDRRAKQLSLSTEGAEYYMSHQEDALKIFYRAYQNAGISAVEGFHRVQQALASSLNQHCKE